LLNKLSKYQIATFTAIFFHLVGLVGILVYDNAFFIRSTPFNMVLSGALLIWTQKNKNIYFYFFLVIACVIGFVVEVIGVNTGLLFGDYGYGKVLGFQWKNVPLLIGLNWFIVMYCSGISIYTLLTRVIKQVAVETKAPSMVLKAMSVIADGATLAVLLDWLMEPVAIKLGYWQWNGGDSVPLYNYICWVVVGALLLTVFHFCKFDKQNKFAINLLLIQVMFFLLLRTFLK